MIEEIMIFVLGFLVAGILALLVLPLFWMRALRLSRRRVELQMPLSLTEVVADRDRLRAEFAVEQCRLEQSIDTLVGKRAETMGRLGRSEAETLSLREKLAASDQALAASRFRVHELEAQFGSVCKELHDSESQLESRSAALVSLQAAHRSLGELADERRAMAAALETRLASLEMRFADSLRELAGARSSQAGSAERGRLLAEQREAAQRRIEALERNKRELDAGATAQARRIETMSRELAQARAHYAEARSEADDLRRETALAEERAKALRSTLERQTETRRAQERELAERLEASQSQLAALKENLEEAQRDNAELRLAAVVPPPSRRRSSSREGRALKGLEVVSTERSEDRPDPPQPRAKDSVLDRPA